MWCTNKNPPVGGHQKGQKKCFERNRQGLCFGGGTSLGYMYARRVLDLQHEAGALHLDVLQQHHLA